MEFLKIISFYKEIPGIIKVKNIHELDVKSTILHMLYGCRKACKAVVRDGALLRAQHYIHR